MHRLTTTALTSVAAVALSLGPGLAPAQADVTAFSDRANDARPTVDIERVRVNNGQRIVVTTTFDNLRRSATGGISVYFDTRGSDRGPEYRAAGGSTRRGRTGRPPESRTGVPGVPSCSAAATSTCV